MLTYTSSLAHVASDIRQHWFRPGCSSGPVVAQRMSGRPRKLPPCVRNQAAYKSLADQRSRGRSLVLYRSGRHWCLRLSEPLLGRPVRAQNNDQDIAAIQRCNSLDKTPEDVPGRGLVHSPSWDTLLMDRQSLHNTRLTRGLGTRGFQDVQHLRRGSHYPSCDSVSQCL
jgi:hypothetical protein